MKKNIIYIIVCICLIIVLIIGMIHVGIRLDKDMTYEYEAIYVDTGLTSYDTSTVQEAKLIVKYKDENGKTVSLEKPYSQWTDAEKYALPLLEMDHYMISRIGVIVYKSPLRNIFGYKYGSFKLIFE